MHIHVILRNRVKELHPSLQGSYRQSIPVNGKPSWTSISSTRRAIWYDGEDWNIGKFKDVASGLAGDLTGIGNYQTPYDDNIPWRYYTQGKFIKAGPGDVILGEAIEN